MSEILLFVDRCSRGIQLIQKPWQWVYIVALVIAWFLLNKSMYSYRKVECHRVQELQKQELLILLRCANLKILFLSILVLSFAWELLITVLIDGKVSIYCLYSTERFPYKIILTK